MAKINRYIKSTLYNLKRRSGQPLTLTNSVETKSYTTGVVTSTATTKTINRALIMESTLVRQILKNQENIFRYNGLFEVSSRQVIIDMKDLGSFDVSLDTKVTINTVDYRITKKQYIEDMRALLLTMSELEGQR